MLTILHTLKPVLVTATAVLWWSRAHGRNAGFQCLGLQLLVSAVVEAFGGYAAISGMRNLWWYDLYVPIEFGLLAAFALSSMPGVRWLVTAGAACFFGLYAMDMRRVYPSGFVSIAYAFGSLILAAAFMTHLVRMATRVEVDLKRSTHFWIYLGHVLFFAGTLPLLGLWNTLLANDREASIALYIINHVLFTLRYGLIAFSTILQTRARIDLSAP